MHFIAVCLLNLHEDEWMKPRNWIPVGWLPVYNESRDTRPKKGFECTSSYRAHIGGKLGTCDILFHAHRFESLDFPFLPADRFDFDVHGALLDDKVHEYVIL